jgi:L-alanine-DL-glutamate epimerase-like enolase superfamily enzyme
MYAIAHIAIHDALNAIDRRYEPYAYDAQAPAGTSADAAVASAAHSALDAALWDLKARLLGVPLVSLLGAAREGVPVYGSGGFTSYTIEQLKEQLGAWAEQGASGSRW